MRKNYLVQCINDTFLNDQIAMIPNRPVKGCVYEIRKVLLTRNGKGVLLEELSNPLVLDKVYNSYFEPSFSVSRFVVVDDLSNSIKEELEELLELENLVI
jgi:hypothetical protein